MSEVIIRHSQLRSLHGSAVFSVDDVTIQDLDLVPWLHRRCRSDVCRLLISLRFHDSCTADAFGTGKTRELLEQLQRFTTSGVLILSFLTDGGEHLAHARSYFVLA